MWRGIRRNKEIENAKESTEMGLTTLSKQMGQDFRRKGIRVKCGEALAKKSLRGGGVKGRR